MSHATAATSPTTPVPNSGALVGTSKFGHLMNLHKRSAAALTHLRQQVAQHQARGDDPAAIAQANQIRATIEQIEQAKASLGSKPGSATRRSFAAMLGTVEQGAAPSRRDMLAVRIGIATDKGSITAPALDTIKRVLVTMDATDAATHSLSRDPDAAADPVKRAQLQTMAGAARQLNDAILKMVAEPATLTPPISNEIQRAASLATTGAQARAIISALT